MTCSKLELSDSLIIQYILGQYIGRPGAYIRFFGYR